MMDKIFKILKVVLAILLFVNFFTIIIFKNYDSRMILFNSMIIIGLITSGYDLTKYFKDKK